MNYDVFEDLPPSDDNNTEFAAPTYARRTPPRQENSRLEIYDWIQCIITALLLGILAFMFLGRVIGVDGTSMVPTLLHGDKVIISNLFYAPRYGDIVVLQTDTFGGDPLVKRIIATEGQTVDIDFTAGVVLVDGVALEETYTADLTFSQEDFSGPVTVPDGCVFVMGDNRNASTDSRDSRVGMVDTRRIIGKVYWIIFPGKTETEVRDWHRIGSVYR